MLDRKIYTTVTCERSHVKGICCSTSCIVSIEHKLMHPFGQKSWLAISSAFTQLVIPLSVALTREIPPSFWEHVDVMVSVHHKKYSTPSIIIYINRGMPGGVK